MTRTLPAFSRNRSPLVTAQDSGLFGNALRPPTERGRNDILGPRRPTHYLLDSRDPRHQHCFFVAHFVHHSDRCRTTPEKTAVALALSCAAQGSN